MNNFSFLDYCCSLWDKVFLGTEENMTVFCFGFYHGIAMALILILLLLLLSYLLFRRVRYCKFLTLKLPQGSLQISAHAVSDLIRSLEDEFDYLEIEKVFLIHTRREKQLLEIHVEYQPSADAKPLHKLAEALQERSIEALHESFGIDSVVSVSVKAGRAKPLKKSF